MSYTPTDICNEALDCIGSDVTIGDIEEGTREAQVCLRHYWQCLRQLLRGAHWAFARKTAPLILLADATGQTPGVGTMVPVPWRYEYAYPEDCMKVRFIPRDRPFGLGSSGAPIFPVPVAANSAGGRLVPARYTIATDYNYPPPSGQNVYDVAGVSPNGRTVVLTDVENAMLVYTALMIYPTMWDPLFRSAMVAYLGAAIALAVLKDKKFAITVRTQQIAIVKMKLGEARVADGNEGWFTTDHTPDWLASRRGGGTWPWGPLGGMGDLGYGAWDSVPFADGSAY